MLRISLFILLLLTSCIYKKPKNLEAELVLDEKAAPGEGAIWNQKEKTLCRIDIEKGILHKFNPESINDEQFNPNKKIGIVVPSEKRYSSMSPVKKVIRKINKNDLKNDFSFWKTQSFEQRLKTLEEIRQEYIEWKYDNKQRFQRVYSIIKR